MSHTPFRELMTAALDEPLTPGERATLEAHFQACSACRALWEALKETDVLLKTAPMMAAPPGFTARAAARIAARSSRPRLIGGGLTLGLGAIVTAGLIGLSLAGLLGAIAAAVTQPGSLVAVVRALAMFFDICQVVVGGLWLAFDALMNWTTGQPYFTAAMLAVLPLVGVWAYVFNKLSPRLVTI